MEQQTLSMTKGEKIDLSKAAPDMANCGFGLGWDVNSTDSAPFDLDATAFLLDANGKLAKNEDVVYFKNLTSPCGSVQHSGDNLTGAGDGDDEVISVALGKVPATVDQIAFWVNIYMSESRKQNFGQVKNAFIRAFNKDTNEEVRRYDLSEDFSTQTAVQLGRLYRHNGVWKFEASGLGSAAKDINEIAQQYR